MTLFSLQIIGAQGPLLSCDVMQVECPAQGGQLGILAGHTPSVGILEAGKIILHMKNKAQKSIDIQGGYMRVDNDGCSIMIQDGVDDIKAQIKAWT